MKFNNCAAWAKGWYKSRENVSSWWIDLCHCINNDGWFIHSKNDVIQWILHRFDTDTEFFKKCHGNFGFYDMNQYIQNEISMYRFHDGIELSYEDGIVLYFRHLLSSAKITCFDKGGFKPSNDVLPLYRRGFYYSDGRWNNSVPCFDFDELLCEAQERVDTMFKDLDEQKIDKYGDLSNFEYIEGTIRGKNWKDVRTFVGDECGCKKYLISGKILSHSSGHVKIEEFDKYNDYCYAELGVYDHSIGYEDDKVYAVYVEHISKWDAYWQEYNETFKVKKIEEYEE